MVGFGHAIPLLSSISGYSVSLILGPAPNDSIEMGRWRIAIGKAKGMSSRGRPTQRGVLERKGHDVFDPLNWNRQGIARKSFTDDNFDAPNVVARVPVVLV